MASGNVYCSKDATVLQSNYGWNGYDNHLSAGYFYGNTYLARFFMYFPINFAGMTSITSATLYLRCSHAGGQGNHCYGGTYERNLEVYRMLADWGESCGSENNWQQSPQGYNWGNRADNVSLTDNAWTHFSNAGTNNSWYGVDVLAMVQNWFNGAPNYGVMVKSSVETGYPAGLEFWSRHVGGSEPWIALVYETNATPTAPDGLAPTGDALINNLTPTFSGVHNSNGDGDTMGGYQIYVTTDADAGVWYSDAYAAPGATSFSRVYAGPALTGNAYYKWQARTYDASGAWGPWSAAQRFKVNSIPSMPSVSISGTPSDEITLTPTIYVTHSDPDASDSQMYGYQVVVVRTSDGAVMWDTGLVGVSPLTTLALTYAGTALAWGGTYGVRARTMDSNSAWGPVVPGYYSLYFTTHAAAIPISLAPTADVVVNNPTPTFTGSRGSANDSLIDVQVRVYASDGSTLLWDSGVTATGVTSTAFSVVYPGSPVLSWDTTYKWQACVTSSVGGVSAWSALQSFVIPAAGNVQCNAPLGSPIATLTPDFQFSRASNFTDYQLIVYENDGTSQHWASGTVSFASTASKSYTYAGTALVWNTSYKWKVRVSSDGGSTWGNGWSGLQAFATDSAGVPTLTLPAVDSWQTTLTPTFTGSSYNSETISTFRIYLYAADGVTLIWDSGNLSGSSTTFSKVYNGSALVKGNSYLWMASYVKASGAPGGTSPMRLFHINADPTSPSGLTPVTGAVVPDTLTPTLSATFEDGDKAAWGDTPTNFEVEVYRNSDSVLMYTLNKTSLVAGANSVKEGEGGTTKTGAGTLSYNVAYKARFRYTDSKSAVGAWSGYVVFQCSHSPTASITTPGATITAPAFTVGWTFASASSKTQGYYQVRVYRVSDGAPMYNGPVTSSAAGTFLVPAGYLQNNIEYTVSVQVWDTDALPSIIYTTNTTASWAAPSALVGLSPTSNEDTSSVLLEWDQSNLSSGDFSHYQIYRRVYGDTGWTTLASLLTLGQTTYTDYTAGQGIQYQYKVTVFKKVTGDIDLESPDSDVVTVTLQSDVWFVVGADMDASHIFELPVTNAPYTEPIQQEIFEPLGTKRKVVVRGKELGAEGTLSLVWKDSERVLAMTQVAYLKNNSGPHLLKSPFGDVWYVEFAGPAKDPQPGGSVKVDLAWTEVA